MPLPYFSFERVLQLCYTFVAVPTMAHSGFVLGGGLYFLELSRILWVLLFIFVSLLGQKKHFWVQSGAPMLKPILSRLHQDNKYFAGAA